MVPALADPAPAHLRDAAQVIAPGPVRGYIQRAFGADLGAAQVAMRTLAEAYPPGEIGERAYGLYVEFRSVSAPTGLRLHCKAFACSQIFIKTASRPPPANLHNVMFSVARVSQWHMRWVHGIVHARQHTVLLHKGGDAMFDTSLPPVWPAGRMSTLAGAGGVRRTRYR